MSPRRFICQTSIAAVIATVALATTSHSAPTSWTAASGADMLWDTAANWSLSLKPNAADDVTFPTPIPNPGSLPTLGTITLTAGEVANSLTFDAAYTLSGGSLTLMSGNVTVRGSVSATLGTQIGGTTGLTKLGSGTLFLGGGASDAVANIYTGTTTVSGGVLRLNKAAGTTAVGGNINLTSGSVFLLASNQIADSATITLSGTAGEFNFSPGSGEQAYNETFANLNVGAGTFTMRNGTSITAESGLNSVTITGTANVTGGSVAHNSGTIISVGALNYTGGTYSMTGNEPNRITELIVGAGGLTMQGTTLTVNKGGASGQRGSQITLGGNVTTNAAATSAVIAAGTNTNGSSIVDMGSAQRTFTVADGIAADDLTISPVIQGTGGLMKTGVGRLVLSGANTFSGGITISGGTLSVTNDGNLGATTNNITIDGGTLRGTATANTALDAGRQIIIGPGGATFESTGSNFGTPSAADRITGSAPITKTGTGNFRVEGANNTLTSNWFVQAGVIEVNNVLSLGTGTITVSGSGNVGNSAGTMANNVVLTGGAISSLNGDRTFSGTVTTNGNGTYYLNDFYQDTARNGTISGKLSSTASTDRLTVGFSRAGSATGTQLTLNNKANDFAGTIRIERNARVNNASSTLAGKTIGTANVELAGGVLFLKDNASGALAYGNNVSVLDTQGNGQSQITANGIGSNNVSIVDVNQASIAGATFSIFQLGTLALGSQTLRVQGGSGYELEFTGATSLTGNSFIEITTAPLTLSGPVNGTAALTKFGTGTLTLANNATAPSLSSITVRGGTLHLSNEAVNNANRIGDAIPVSLTAGSLALRGNKTSDSSETLGAVTIGSGAVLAVASATSTVNTTLNLGSLTRSNDSSTLAIRTRAAGTLGGVDKVIVSGGGPALNAAGIVGGWGVNATDSQFLTYGANGFASAAFSADTLAGATANDIVFVTAAETVAAGTSVNAARFEKRAITGSALTIGSGGLILNNDAAPVDHSAPLIFGSTSARGTAYLYANNTAGQQVDANTPSAVLSGLITASSIVKNGLGAVRISNTGQSNNAGLANVAVVVNEGTLDVGDRAATNDGNALPSTATVVVNGGSINFYQTQTIAGMTGNGTVRVGANTSGSTAKTLTVNNNVDNFFGGTFQSDDSNSADASLTKGGVGKLTFGGMFQSGRTLQVNMGEVVFTNNVTMGSANSDRQRIIIGQGGAFTLDNTVSNVNDRIALNAGTSNGGGYFQLSGGTFNLLGSSNVNTTETFGTSSTLAAGNSPFFGQGMDVINITPGTGRAGILVSEQNIARNTGATVLFQGANFGGTRAAANTATFNYNTSGPTLVGGGGTAGNATFGVMPGQFVNSIIGGVDTYGIATFTGTGTTGAGVRRLATNEQATTLTSGATALNNIRLTSAVTGIDTATTVNSIHLAGNGSIAGSGTLTVNSGTILSANNGATGANALDVVGLAFGTVEATFFTPTDLTVSSVISGSNGLTKGGAGKLILSGVNTFGATETGALGVTVNGGLLSVSGDANLGASANTVRLNNGGGLEATATLNSARGVVLGNAGGVIDVENKTDTLTLSGTISGSLGTINGAGIAANTGTVAATTTVLEKTGLGTLLLTGANSFTGRTEVNEGTLLVGNGVSGSLPANSFVEVNAGGTLGGAGSIGGNVTVNAGGTLAPGIGAGHLNTGSLSLTNGSTFSLELNSTIAATGYDQAGVTGNLSLGSSALSLTLGFNPTNNVDIFYVILNDGSDAVTGTFAGLAQGAVFTAGGQQFMISYTAEAGTGFAGVGNDVAIMAVPEPGSLGTLLGGLATLAGLQRFRRRRI